MHTVRIGFFAALILGAGACDDGPPVSAEDAPFCAFPMVTGAALTDIHEGSLNGPEGFAYFVEAGDHKVGVLPESLGLGDQAESFDTCVYASNFQGPILVKQPVRRPVFRLRRFGDLIDQWEWSADGERQESTRRYPLVYGHRCVHDPAELAGMRARLRIMEHDDFGLPDDPVGAFTVDLSACATVLAAAEAGWTAEMRVAGEAYRPDGGGPADVAEVTVRLWCYGCSGTRDCRLGVGPDRRRECGR